MVAAANIDNAVAGAVTSWGFTAAALLQLAAGDAINLRHDAAGPSAGRVNYARIALTRIGRAWGLP
jgi:hypothetical protein